MPRTTEITDFHKSQLLAVLMHYLQPDMRRTLMREVPAAYNDWCDSEIVEVVHISDGRKVTDS
jgi:hypothetical protein